VWLAVVLTLAGCGGEPRPSDAELGAQIWQHPETAAEVRVHTDCLTRTASATRPTSDLGLERIEAVLAGCAAEESALIREVERVWGNESRTELDGRTRGIAIEALRIIKETPYVPARSVVPVQ
jgi:hypothetical protein